MKVGKALIDVGGCGKFGIGEKTVDVLQHQRVGIDEDAAVVFRQLPEPQLAEVVERRVKVGFAALGERGSVMNILAAMTFVEGVRQRQEVGGNQPAAKRDQWLQRQLVQSARMEYDNIRQGARQPDGAGKRCRSHGVVGIRHQRDERIVRSGGTGRCDAITNQTGLRHETDFSLRPSGSWLILVAMPFVQAETAGMRLRSTR